MAQDEMIASGGKPSPVEHVPLHSHRSVLFFSVVIAIIAALQMMAGRYPRSVNWGLHQVGIFSPVTLYASTLLSLALALFPVQRFLYDQVESITRIFFGKSGTVKLLAVIFLVPMIYWFARERVFLYGDSYIVSQVVKRVTFEDQAQLFHNEPLAGILNRLLSLFLTSVHAMEDADVLLQLVSILFSIVYFVALYRFAVCSEKNPMGRTLLFAFMMVSGGTLLFFGHVENYSPLFVTILVYVFCGVKYLQGKAHLGLPALVNGILLPLHFGAIVFFPSLIMLFLIEGYRRKFRSVVVALVVWVLTMVSILWLCDYSPQMLYNVIHKGGNHFLPLTGTSTKWQAYTLFSAYHILDVANLLALLSVFSPFFLVVLFDRKYRNLLVKDTAVLFLGINAAGGFGFIFFMNSEIGLSMDWDLMAGFYLPFTIFTLILWLRSHIPDRIKYSILTAIIVLTFLHTLSFALLNIDEERALGRYTLLLDRKLLSTNALLTSFERLVLFYDERGNYGEEEYYYRRYLELDSTNERVLSNVADFYQRQGDEQRMTLFLEKAVRCNTVSPTVYFALAQEYRTQQRDEEAFQLDRHGLLLDSTSLDANMNVGIHLVRVKDSIREAIPYFKRAASADTTAALAYYYLGACYEFLHDRILRDLYW